MSLFNNILHDIQKRLSGQVVNRSKVYTVLQEKTNITFLEEDMVIRGSVVTLTVMPLMRQELLLRKPQLLKALQDAGLSVTNIYISLK